MTAHLTTIGAAANFARGSQSMKNWPFAPKYTLSSKADY
jgi:hypothetical protein